MASLRLDVATRTGWPCRARSNSWQCLALLVCLWSIPSTARASQPDVEPMCKADSDCLGCALCSGGVCSLIASATCLCDDECIPQGAKSCIPFREDSPLCGGTCSSDPVVAANACGVGPDAYAVEPFEVEWTTLEDGGMDVVSGHGEARDESGIVWARSDDESRSDGDGSGRWVWLSALTILGAIVFARRRAPAWGLQVLHPRPVAALAALGAIASLSSCEETEISSGGISAGGTSLGGTSPDSAGGGGVPAFDSGPKPSSIAAPESLPAADGPLHLDCDGWQLHGPLVRLPPNASLNSSADLTAHGTGWLVVTPGRDGTSYVQAIDSRGLPLGPTRLLGGASPYLLDTAPSGRVVISGWIPPAYALEGRRTVMVGVTPDLEEVTDSWLLTGPVETQRGRLLAAEDEITRLEILPERQVPALRSLHLDARGTLDQSLMMPSELVKDGSSPSSGLLSWEGRVGWLVQQTEGIRLLALDAISRQLLSDFTFDNLPTQYPERWALASDPGRSRWALLRATAEERAFVFRVDWALDGEFAVHEVPWPTGSAHGITEVQGRLLVWGSQTPSEGEPPRPRLQMLEADGLALVDDLAPLVPGVTPENYAAITHVVPGQHGVGVLLSVWVGTESGSYFARIGCTND